MRIAILTSYFFHETEEIQGRDRIVFGGAERYLVELCHLFKSIGHDVDVYQSLNQQVVRDGQPGRLQSGQVDKEYEGIKFSCLPGTHTWIYSVNPVLNMTFNEVAAHYDLQIYFAPFLCWPYVPPTSISVSHGIYWDYHSHSYRDYTEADKKEFMKRQIYGFTGPAVCVACDSNTRKVVAAISPGDESKIAINYNFVDTKKFVPNEKKDWEEFRVLYPRRLTSLRGCNDFIRVSRDLPDYKYLAVGQAGNEGMEDAVRKWGEGRNNIRFVSRPMEQMVEIYQQADIAVVPTIACEGLSLSLLEAMSCGLPIITTPVGGLGDAVIPDYNALIYEPNVGGLNECIYALAEDPELMQKFGQRNREIAVESFDIEFWRKRWTMILHGFGG